MPTIGPTELIVVLVIALLILGPKRLPGAGRSLGRGMREFKDSLTGGSDRAERLPAAEAETDDGEGPTRSTA
ncbi:MAG: twin-arginine translocase TatA/TatE family subunit [Actinomycetota bacterium]|nr:twin-arginine translocase TatA/TatE family subunit [Actinomycetota bacterium]